jgi:hypothetical protein
MIQLNRREIVTLTHRHIIENRLINVALYKSCVNVSSVMANTKILAVKAGPSIDPAHLPCQPGTLFVPTASTLVF